MRCVQKSLVLSSNLVGISLDSIFSTKKISFSLAFHVNSFTRAHVSKLIGQRLFFKTLSAHPLALFGLSLMWIISVCSLYLKLRIRQASTAIACICAKSCIMIFGWCILLVSVVSVKRIKSAGIKCLLMMCMAAVATIIWLFLDIARSPRIFSCVLGATLWFGICFERSESGTSGAGLAWKASSRSEGPSFNWKMPKILLDIWSFGPDIKLASGNT